MKLQFKHQKFQADAAKAVVDVFAGQPYLTPTYMMDRGFEEGEQQVIAAMDDFTGWRNERIVPELSDKLILEHLQKVQRTNQIKPSDKLEGRYNLTIEMETGVGKTYTYIKIMYELNKHYGWSKFIVVVPSIAIREGVYKSFQVTQEHFAEEYGKKIRFFIYNSAQLTEIDRFASDSAINVMIINSQAFNAKGKDARRIYMKLDEFRSRRPIDIIAKTNPILIIDEPQSVEGKQTKERLKEFNPLLTLRYSATHKSDSIYNMVYRLTDSNLNHTGIYLYSKGKIMIHLTFDYQSDEGCTTPGQYLRYHRTFQGLTTRELAEKVGVVPATLVLYENDRHPIKHSTAVALANVLGIDRSRLLDEYTVFVDYPYSSLLKKVRRELSFTQMQMAEVIGIGQTTYSGWEREVRVPRRKEHEKILAAMKKLKVDVDTYLCQPNPL